MPNQKPYRELCPTASRWTLIDIADGLLAVILLLAKRVLRQRYAKDIPSSEKPKRNDA